MQHSHAEAVLFKNDKWDNALSVLNTHPDLTAIESGREQSLGELVTSSVESIYGPHKWLDYDVGLFQWEGF